MQNVDSVCLVNGKNENKNLGIKETLAMEVTRSLVPLSSCFVPFMLVVHEIHKFQIIKHTLFNSYLM